MEQNDHPPYGVFKTNVTAVDWIIKEAAKIGKLVPVIFYKKAKSLQKQQHYDTWHDSRLYQKGEDYIGKEKTFEEYYNETYNQ